MRILWRLINSKPKVLEFANFQRFFCCTGCKNQYKEKHEGRIRSLVEQYKAMQKGRKTSTSIFLAETNYVASAKSLINNIYLFLRLY